MFPMTVRRLVIVVTIGIFVAGWPGLAAAAEKVPVLETQSTWVATLLGGLYLIACVVPAVLNSKRSD